MFWSQLKKELMSLRGDLLLTIGGFLVWEIFLHTRMGLWEPWLPLMLSLAPLFFVPFWMAWNGVNLFHQEWSANTHYLMLSLPVRAWRIWLAKLFALLVSGMSLTAFVAATAFTLAPRALALSPELQAIAGALPPGWLLKISLQVGAALLGSSLVLAIITQFAYLFSRMFERFQWLVMAWTVFLMFWLMERFVGLVEPVLRWLPGLRIHLLELGERELVERAVMLDSAPVVATAVFGVLIAMLINVVIEDALEV